MYPTFMPTEMHEHDRWAARVVHHAEFLTRKPEYLRFRARVGKTPMFLTSHEAVQYERGFVEHPNQPPGLEDSPRMQGYCDAEEANAFAMTGRIERRDSTYGGLT